jgi:hypothetical protein
LFVALYAQGATISEPCHWILISSPKEETKDTRGMRFYSKGSRRPGANTGIWDFEGRKLATIATSMLLVRT